MQPDDIGLVMDTDETFTRDFLRAAQICDVPQFRPGQNCLVPRTLAAAMVFESSPECITQDRLSWCPDMVLGECIEHIGNETLHKPGVREFNGIHGKHARGYGREGYGKMPNTTMYPLLSTGDFQNYDGGMQVYLVGGSYDWYSAREKTNQPIRYTGYHFHNFFDDADTIRRKYKTFGHPTDDVYKKSLGEIAEDLKTAVDCVMDRPGIHVISGLEQMVGPKPIFFTDKYRKQRHKQFRRIIEEDESKYGVNASETKRSHMLHR